MGEFVYSYNWCNHSFYITYACLIIFKILLCPILNSRRSALVRLKTSMQVYWNHLIHISLWATRKDVQKPLKKVICWSQSSHSSSIMTIIVCYHYLLAIEFFLGGKVSDHPLGTWSIPTVIQDEELYRLKLKSDISWI